MSLVPLPANMAQRWQALCQWGGYYNYNYEQRNAILGTRRACKFWLDVHGILAVVLSGPMAWLFRLEVSLYTKPKKGIIKEPAQNVVGANRFVSTRLDCEHCCDQSAATTHNKTSRLRKRPRMLRVEGSLYCFLPGIKRHSHEVLC